MSGVSEEWAELFPNGVISDRPQAVVIEDRASERRLRVVRTMPEKPGRSKQTYGTPPELIRAVEKLFEEPLAFDLAASFENHKAPGFFTEADDSLSRPWHTLKGLLWLNPPFANIGKWAAKCAEESQKGARILLLVPASIGANWFSDHVHKKAYVMALQPRLTFEGMADPFPKDCILACYGVVPGFDVWRWK